MKRTAFTGLEMVPRSAQVFLQLDADAKKQLDGMQKEINVVKAAVEGADSEAVLERVSQQVKTTILDLYYRNAKLKVRQWPLTSHTFSLFCPVHITCRCIAVMMSFLVDITLPRLL